MTTRYPALCRACARYQDKGLCTSFPGGIPDRIFAYGEDHRESISGEQPFEFEPGKQEEYDAWLRLHRNRERRREAAA